MGVVYRELPNITYAKGPMKSLMQEETPKNGILPEQTLAKNLFNEMVGLIVNSDGDMLQTWSCATPGELANYKWWWELPVSTE